MLGFFSCKDEEITREKEFTTVKGDGLIINTETITVELEEVMVVDVFAEDTVKYNDQDFVKYEVELEGSLEELEQIEIGTVINMPIEEKGGKVMIVYEIIPTKENGEKGIGAVTLKAIQATLDLYFTGDNSIIEFSTPDNRSKKNSAYPEKLTGSELVFSEHLPTFESKLEGLSFTTSVEQLFEGSLSTKIWKSGDSYIEVNGSFGIHPAIDLYMEYEPQTFSFAVLNGMVGLFEAAYVPDLALLFSQDKNYVLGNMKQLRAVVYTDVDKKMSVKVHLEKEFDFVKRIPIGKLTIPTFPVSGNVELAFELDFEAMGTLDFETYKKEEYDIVVGVDLQKDLPDPVWYYEKAYREEDGFQLKAKIELSAGVSIILETEIYVLGVIGPEISVEAYVEAIASVEASVSSENPLEINWELKADAGINGNASLNLAFFHHDPATWKIWEYPFVKYRENIYTAPNYLKAISGADQQGDFGMQLPNPVVIGAYDSKDNLIEYLPVPVYFETENGSVNSVDFSEEGKVEAIWVLDEENENQTLNSYFKFEDVKKGEIEINVTATEHIGPTAPVLMSPVNEATDQVTENLLLKWEAGNSEETNISYAVYLGETSELNESDLVIAGMPFTTAQVEANNNTLYYWKIVASDADGNETPSEIWSFTTQGDGSAILLTTEGITNITETTATCGGSITDEGGATITARGVCWSTSSNPTIEDNYSSDGTGTGIYTSSMSGLTANIKYYVRAYATNSNGTFYGNEQSFSTSQSVGLPTLTTNAITNITETTATCGGNITDDGGATITARGVCWSTGSNPTIADNYTSDGNGTGAFTSSINGLTAGTAYYIRAYASNSEGTTYGNEQSFTTNSPFVGGQITDIDGNGYQTVKIGEQWWMAENLKVTRYADGTEIPLITDNGDWIYVGELGKAYCYYNNNINNEVETYGALYTWAAAVNGEGGNSTNQIRIQGVCPDSWHIPSDNEWKELEMFLGMSQEDADLLGFRGANEGSKIAGNAFLWNSGALKDESVYGSSGFDALPSGYRIYYASGSTGLLGMIGQWWSSTRYGTSYKAYTRKIASDYTTIRRYNDDTRYGFSVRCVKD